ncbi:hypothetical protein ES703_58579 [subsurface metagenome]
MGILGKDGFRVIEMKPATTFTFVCPRGVFFRAGKVNFRIVGDYLEISAESGKFDHCDEEDEKCPESCFSVRFRIEPERRGNPPNISPK